MSVMKGKCVHKECIVQVGRLDYEEQVHAQ